MPCPARWIAPLLAAWSAAYTFDPPLESGGWRITLRARVTPTEIDRPVLEVDSPPLAVVVAGAHGQ